MRGGPLLKPRQNKSSAFMISIWLRFYVFKNSQVMRGGPLLKPRQNKSSAFMITICLRFNIFQNSQVMRGGPLLKPRQINLALGDINMFTI